MKVFAREYRSEYVQMLYVTCRLTIRRAPIEVIVAHPKCYAQATLDARAACVHRGKSYFSLFMSCSL